MAWSRGLRPKGRIRLRRVTSIKTKYKNSRKDSTLPIVELIITPPTPEDKPLPITATAHPTPTDTSHSVPNHSKPNNKTTKSPKSKPPSSNKSTNKTPNSDNKSSHSPKKYTPSNPYPASSHKTSKTHPPNHNIRANSLSKTTTNPLKKNLESWTPIYKKDCSSSIKGFNTVSRTITSLLSGMLTWLLRKELPTMKGKNDKWKLPMKNKSKPSETRSLLYNNNWPTSQPPHKPGPKSWTVTLRSSTSMKSWTNRMRKLLLSRLSFYGTNWLNRKRPTQSWSSWMSNWKNNWKNPSRKVPIQPASTTNCSGKSPKRAWKKKGRKTRS